MKEEKLTFCSECFDGKRGCRKLTQSILSDDGTHYDCAECGELK